MKKISPVALNALQEALTAVYWYKSDLRGFLSHALSEPELLSRLNWGDYKRNIVSSLIGYLARNEEHYQADLLRLMTEVTKIRDFSHLERLEDGKKKARTAADAVAALRELVSEHLELVDEQRKIEERREKAREERLQQVGVRNRLDELQQEYFGLLGLTPQRRGYALEKLMYSLFELFDLDPKASFRIAGEQIDGSFSFEGTDFLFEARWEDSQTKRAELDAFSAKVRRKLENTLGLFLSINGFSEDGVKAFSSGRSLIILMDGADLMAVLEGRIDLVTLLLRKRRYASQTGEIYLTVNELLK